MNGCLAGKRILLLEDEFLVAAMAEDMLVDLGATVVGPASRLADGLAYARTAALDAAVLDVNLNGEMSVPVAYVLADRRVPLVYASGYGRTGARLGPPGPVIDKPFTRETLCGALRQALAGAGAG